MCGGGVGSANDSSNDDEQGSGNSFKETLANIFTPGDGMSYVDGRLTENRSAADPSRAKFYDYSANNKDDDGPGYTNIMVDGEQRKIRRDANDAYKQSYASALLGAATGGLPGLVGSIVTNKITKGATGQALLNTADTAGDAVGGLKSFFAAPTFPDTEEGRKEEAAYREQQRARQDAMMATMMEDASKNDNSAPAQTVSLAPAPAPALAGLPAISDMSQAAAQGAFEPIPNPDYDPSDPLSPRFLLNPTYEQLRAYRDSQSVAMGMAMGGRAQIGMGFPGGPAMGGFGNETYGQLGSLMDQNPLQQYGGYLEQQYGNLGFDQKKNQFLQEVQQKEQQTFGGGLQPSNSSSIAAMQQSYREDPREVIFPSNFPPVGNVYPMQESTQRFAEGGEVGGNEKTMIADAVSAVKGEMSQEESAVVLGQFLATYGEDALRDLVDKVQSGELDDTVERFANGEAGEVNGPGDGSGVDDKVPASLEGQQDVLLADGEFVLRKKTADALEKKYGGGFLDAINEAETDAPRTMREYMAKTA